MFRGTMISFFILTSGTTFSLTNGGSVRVLGGMIYV